MSQPAGSPKPIIGLAGGMGSGKSEVARLMGRLGAAVIDSDRLAHQELDSQEVRQKVGRWWGRDLLRTDGSVDRAKLAQIVFVDESKRRRLEQLIHPALRRKRARLIEQARGDPQIKAIVIDSPLLFELGLERDCDVVVFVEAGLKLRLERLARSRGWDRQEVARREKWHKPLDFKRARSDYIIKNESSIDALRRQVEKTFSRIISSARTS